VNLKKLFLAGVVACALVAVSACETVRDANPVAVGCEDVKPATAALCGYSIYGTFVVNEETALKVARDVGPGAVRNAIIAADEKAKPIGDKLQVGLAKYEQVRARVAAGTSTQQQLTIALTELVGLIDDLQPLVGDLLGAIAKGAK
jgi:hypothetical protein